MFIDESTITISGGHGGAGIVSFGKMEKSGPDGGNGGRGGDLWVEATSDLTLLSQFQVETEFAAEDGHSGGKKKRTGKDGADLVIRLPVGTTLTEIETVRQPGLVTSGETIELTSVGQRVLISKGGIGGRGNYEFRSPRRTTPRFAQSGLPGEKRIFHVNLKLIADFGLIGLPNAGKSSLLNELTNANAKVGNYSFTTLTPNLGICDGRVIADIPGLIEGAHEGRGLGIKFLKHIEKVAVILHCISAESQDLAADYNTVREELALFKKRLLKKPEVLLLTKSDMVEDHAELLDKVELLKRLNPNIITISIHDLDAIEKLKSIVKKNTRSNFLPVN